MDYKDDDPALAAQSRPTRFLCRRQGTKFPVLPIHTPQERRCLSQILEGQRTESGRHVADSTAVAYALNSSANGTDTFYKSAEYIDQYLRGKSRAANSHNSRLVTRDVRQALATSQSSGERLCHLEPPTPLETRPAASIGVSPRQLIISVPTRVPREECQGRAESVQDLPPSDTRREITMSTEVARFGSSESLRRQFRCRYCRAQGYGPTAYACPGRWNLKRCLHYQRLPQRDQSLWSTRNPRRHRGNADE